MSMDAIAQASGVTKRTLYKHFDSKDALVAASLEVQQQNSLVLFQKWGEDAASPADLVSRVFEGLATWAATPRWVGSGYTRLTMELADLPGHPVRAVAHRHKLLLEEWLADELSRLGLLEAGEAARRLMLLIEGSMCLMVIHGDCGYATAAQRAADLLLQDYAER